MSLTCPLNITIIGAGIGGLAAATFLSQSGHNVNVLEANPYLSEVGAGIQVTANAMRIFDRHGLKDALYKEGNRFGGATIKRWDNGKVLGEFMGMPTKLYDYDNVTIHRADYQRILYHAALEAGAKIGFGKKVIGIDSSTPSVALEDGTKLHSDLIVAADGIGSRTRTSLFPTAHAQPTPDSIHRVILPSATLLSSPILTPLVRPGATIWLGPHKHIVGYTIRGTELYNLVFASPEKGTAEVGVWNEPAFIEDLKEQYGDWEETIKEILDKAGAVHKWRVGVVPDLPSWKSESGKVVLLGDAAHAMMPYAAQGASQSVEDAVVLAGCLNRAREKEDVPKMAEAYETMRKERAEKVKATSWGNMKQFGMVDGEEQEERDKVLALTLISRPADDVKQVERVEKDINAKYGSAGFSMWLYAYDVEQELKQYFGDEMFGIKPDIILSTAVPSNDGRHSRCEHRMHLINLKCSR